MLHIHNIRKIQNRKVFGGWVVKDINNHPTQGKYMFDIQCFSPLGVGSTIDRCTISLNRTPMVLRANPMVLSAKWKPADLVYYFNYNGEGTNVCGSAEWLGDMKNFVGQLEYIIKKYHNKQ
jgi:hypothetical protein